MRTGPNAGFNSAVNDFAPNARIYSPSKSGIMLLRILPAFDDEGNELPWVDFENGGPETNEGLGDQHYELGAVTLFIDRTLHWFSSVCRDGDGSIHDSPAYVAAAKLKPLFKQAGDAADAGYSVDPRLMPSKFGGGFISAGTRHCLQAIVYQAGGKPVNDRATGQPPIALVTLPFSAVQDLRGKLFKARRYSADGTNTASLEDNQLGDYASCAEGCRIAISVNPAAKKVEYVVDIADPLPLDPEWARSVFVPWEEMFPVPTMDSAYLNLSRVMDADLLGYSLKGTRFEHLLSPEHLRMAESVSVITRDSVPSRPAASSSRRGNAEDPQTAHSCAPPRVPARPSGPPRAPAQPGGAPMRPFPGPGAGIPEHLQRAAASIPGMPKGQFPLAQEADVPEDDDIPFDDSTPDAPAYSADGPVAQSQVPPARAVAPKPPRSANAPKFFQPPAADVQV